MDTAADRTDPGGTLADLLLPAGASLLPVLQVLGIPFIALLVDVLLCAWLLGVRRGWSRSRVAAVLNAALPGVSVVILITGASAIFAKVLVVTGIATRWRNCCTPPGCRCCCSVSC